MKVLLRCAYLTSGLKIKLPNSNASLTPRYHTCLTPQTKSQADMPRRQWLRSKLKFLEQTSLSVPKYTRPNNASRPLPVSMNALVSESTKLQWFLSRQQ